MFGNIFFHNTTRKVIDSFGTLFNDIWVIRVDKFGNEVKRIKVPIAYGPREHWLIRLKDDPEETLDRPVSITLPRMSFDITHYNYAGVRKLNTIHKAAKSNTTEQVSRQFNPVCWDIGIDLSIMTKTHYDSNQIVEQIIPWFTPDYTVTINAIPSLGIKDDLPIVFTNWIKSDNFDDGWLQRRDVIHTLSFVAKAKFYGPILPQKVITQTQEDFLVPGAIPGTGEFPEIHDEELPITPRAERVTITPDPPSSVLEDPFGYDQVTETFDDNKKFNPGTGVDEDIP